MNKKPGYEMILLLRKLRDIGEKAELSSACRETDCSWNEAYYLADVLKYVSMIPDFSQGCMYATITDAGRQYLEEIEPILFPVADLEEEHRVC